MEEGDGGGPQQEPNKKGSLEANTLLLGAEPLIYIHTSTHRRFPSFCLPHMSARGATQQHISCPYIQAFDHTQKRSVFPLKVFSFELF